MPTSLAELTTLRLGGPAARVVVATQTGGLVDAVTAADRVAEPVLLVGGGSNLVVADEGWPGAVVLIRTRGVETAGTTVTAAAGEPWDEFVKGTINAGLSGLAALSGIPGLVGATPVQNVGAYGVEVSQFLKSILLLDRATGTVSDWPAGRCEFGFRTSMFKHTDQFVILAVTFELVDSPNAPPVQYAELARRLGIEPGTVSASAKVRDVVLDLRRGKGMLLDAADPDTWSVGSFFVNPFVAENDIPAGCPHWFVDGAVKLPAGWLIEQAGYTRGYGNERVSLSTKHALALTNRGTATTSDLLALAREIRDGVETKFGIRLNPEARLAGVIL